MKTIFVAVSFLLPQQTIATQNTFEGILHQYADIAHAMYEDSLIEAKNLQSAIEKLIQTPSETNLQLARQAWKKARVPYQQTEGYRFGNPDIDEWEGHVNAWPLDEGLIDYVKTESYGEDSEENPFYTANIIANTSIKFGTKALDVSKINKSLLKTKIHEIDGIEANVATGYHAIEFLLWGQDHHDEQKKSGERPARDFNVENCAHPSCQRRIDYLRTTTNLLIDELTYATNLWTENGLARKRLLSDEKKGIQAILMGLGSLSYGELAGERIKLGLMLHDPEEEHDCFSDNTHFSHFYNQVGMMAIYYGKYKRINGEVIEGSSLHNRLMMDDILLAKEIANALDNTLMAMQKMVDRAEQVEHYDQMLAMGNIQGNKTLENVIKTLLDQAKSFEKAMRLLAKSDVQFLDSDALQ